MRRTVVPGNRLRRCFFAGLGAVVAGGLLWWSVVSGGVGGLVMTIVITMVLPGCIAYNRWGRRIAAEIGELTKSDSNARR